MVTRFQQRVYDETRKIPRGSVVTYGELARRIGCGSARAVGQALRVNPFAPEVPCHRVVAADGSLAGFCGKRDAASIGRKRKLLEAEGVRFDEKGRVRR
ncbi:MAG: MGMT family protein [Kiritimatiellia bacterium]